MIPAPDPAHQLTHMEQRVLSLRLYTLISKIGMSVGELATIWGMDAEEIREIELSALMKLQAHLNATEPIYDMSEILEKQIPRYREEKYHDDDNK